MGSAGFDVVTGATSYTGKYIARHLLAKGRTVRSLARRWDANVFGQAIQRYPLDFADPAGLVANLRGADTLYNTFWIRFPRDGTTFADAVENTRILVEAAVQAGIRRIVHMSVSNASSDSPFGYFRGKAETEKIVRSSGLPHAIIRPTLTFGLEDILVNNIAWSLRHFPVFLMPGGGHYRCQPVYVGDVAAIAVDAGEREGDTIQDAVGPDIFTFADLVTCLRQAIGSGAKILSVPAPLALAAVRAIDPFVRDELLRSEELAALMNELLVSADPPLGRVGLATWLKGEGRNVGAHYMSERQRHWARVA